MSARTGALLRLGRLLEALSASQAFLAVSDGAEFNAMGAAVHFAARGDASAVRLARKSISQMARGDAADPLAVAVVLTLAASEARAGHLDRAEAALKDFYAAVPHARTIAQIKGWLLDYSPVPYEDTFFDALRQAGVGG